MDLAQIRLQEMTRLADTNQEVPDQVRQRLQDQIQQALQICATLDNRQMDRTLLQIRDRLQQQDRDLELLQLHTGQNTMPTLLQTRTMLQQRLQLVDEGLLNHEMFRNTVRNGFRFGQETTVTPPAQNGNGFQNGQPTLVPTRPNTNPGEPNTAPTGSSYGPGEPNTNPRRLKMSATPSPTTGGGGMGGNGTGGAGSDNGGTGGNGSGGNGTGTGGNGSGGNGTGGMDGSGSGTGGGGGGGSGSGGQGGKP